MAAIHSLPSPASDELSDCDAEVVARLERKRRQVDEEIARFKAQKEKEFRDFEKGLRWNRKRSRSPNATDTSPAKPPSANTPSVLSLLAAGSGPQLNGDAHKKRSADRLMSPKSKPPPGKPTLSLDKLTINGTTTPPVLGTPPANANPVTMSLSRSPSNTNIALTPPRGRAASKNSTTPSHDRNDISFAGLFTPAYLPLLDSRPRAENRSGKEQKSETEPLTKSESVLPLTSDVTPLPEPVPPSTSLSHESSPTLLTTHSRRALTAPVLPSTFLPSALRTASGTTMRKRKKVTFQLSGSVVVEPSSSYEELPTPDLPDSGTIGDVERNGIEEIIEEDTRRPSPNADESSIGSKAVETADLVQTGFVPIQLALPNTAQRTANIDSTNPLPTDSTTTALTGGLPEAEDGGGGVGFFELDEELESPGAGEANPYSHVDDVDVDEVLEEPDGSGTGGRGVKKREKNGKAGSDADEDEFGEEKFAAFTSGSVPIDIVNRSSSWFGSYGH